MSITVEDMAKVGCTTARGIRFWESEELLGVVERTAGNQRRYTEMQLERAKIIAAAKFAGFDLEAVKGMLDNYDTEAHGAILYRLMQQAALATTLADSLPMPEDSVQPEQVFDL